MPIHHLIHMDSMKFSASSKLNFCFLELGGFFSHIFSIHGWLNSDAEPTIQGASCTAYAGMTSQSPKEYH